MVKTSRRMPPTPVAAPWYGSMNDGWLCDSILKTAAKPSPMSTTPAFSPGPWMTRGPFVGSRARWTRDDLYEQCSLHITLNTPSSVYVGVAAEPLDRARVLVGDSLCERRELGVDLRIARERGRRGGSAHRARS